MITTWIWTGLLALQEIAVLAAIVAILRRRQEPRGMLAWILALLLLPVVGLILFLAFSEPRRGWHRKRREHRRRELTGTISAETLPVPPPEVTRIEGVLDPGVSSLADFAKRLGAHAATRGNDVVIYYDAEKTFLAIQLALEAAERSIHIEYYIFQPDETGRAVRDLLIAKARQGVRCRVLLDFVGCWRLPRSFVRAMEEAGIQVAFAMPVVPWRGRWRVNYRNHRKIIVIDGKVGFTGSQNIGDEYRGRLARLGPWRDTHMKIVGPGVRHLQEVFVEDWYYTTQEQLSVEEWFPPIEPAGEHLVQIVPTGPDQEIHVMHQLLFAAVGAARSSISMITPYFAPDTAMVLALKAASYRGVRVGLIVPTCTDHKFVLWAGQSFYPELCSAGIEIYEHDETMLHSKTLVVDRTWAMVGSPNLDERSFRINFEVTTILYSEQLATDLYDDFETLRDRSRLIRLEDVDDPPLLTSLRLGLARLASPVL
ncbi:MAG: cardiolipin synthase [Phycisphaerae bacterium]|nr:cardiolipin synthase [Phycisphaerae bacterium]